MRALCAQPTIHIQGKLKKIWSFQWKKYRSDTVKRKDIKSIHEIFSDTNAYSGTLQLPFPSLSLWESRLENIPQGIYYLVAEIDNEVVGQIGLHIEQNPRRKHVATFGMGVKDKHQGKGVGSKLLSSAIDLAENWINIQRMELTVYTDNEPAIALYKKHGFVR